MGNSGGPLINSKGDVVGLITFKISAEGVEGLNFALSSEVAFDYCENKLTNLEKALEKEVAAQNPPHWIVAANNDDFKIEYDINSINFVKKNVFDIWTATKHKTTQTAGKRFYNEKMDLWRYDCTEKSYALQQIKTVYIEGDTSSSNVSQNKSYAKPNSVAWIIMDRVCLKGQNNSLSGETIMQQIEDYSEEMRRNEYERKERLRREYCRKGEALRNKIEFYKNDVQAKRYIVKESVPSLEYDENLNRYQDAMARLKGAEMELHALEDELHRLSFPDSVR